MKFERKSPLRMGWLMAMFDLPVILDEERKEAARFRKALLDDGFIMIQYSVYSRPCVSLERMAKYALRQRLWNGRKKKRAKRIKNVLQYPMC